MSNEKYEAFKISQIGKISRKSDNEVEVHIFEKYRPALLQLEHFSHVIVLWWAHEHDNEKSRSKLDCHPPYAEEKLTGLFATRSEYRPNPIGITTCPIKSCDMKNGIIKVGDIDAIDNTPVIDLKAYFPVLDRVENVSIPEWLYMWPEWMPEKGIGLQY